MTVEQPPVPRYTQTSSREDHTYAKVKEITGITDKSLIHQAINACSTTDGKYEVAEVVNMLIADDSPQKKSSLPTAALPTAKMAITYPKESDSVDAIAGSKPVSTKNAKGVIDLTSDNNETDDIQKAIAASLQDTQTQDTPGILGGQVSREEQDISRILEQSLIESKAGTKRKRGDIWFVDPLNPHERKRQDGWPVGLKNVGNTCWFSAVIQSLFHLRRFRHLVLNYQPNKDISQCNPEEKRNLRFMQELRHLFALMIGSKRKYVDPSKSVDILKEAFSSSPVTSAGVSDSQQDVSEFQHKLLEWLEDAFKSCSRPSSPTEGAGEGVSQKCSDNPMLDLFYGQYRADGINEGKGFSNEENFGQFPLQVNGFRDIHESLEAAMAHKEIETISSEATQKSGQELWFTKLPPMLTFELSRFQFNQALGRPEKIHNKIEFPQVIYMDRYMDFNKQETRERRERGKKLKEELGSLQARLDKFINYGSGSKRFPLQDVLLYALEFARSKPEHSNKQTTVSQDVEMTSPIPTSSALTHSPVKSPPDVSMATVKSPTDVTMAMDKSLDSPEVSMGSIPVPDVNMDSTKMLSNTPPDISMVPAPKSPHTSRSMEVVTSPYPRRIADSELRVLEDCLHRWRTEVESDVRELQENIGGLEDSINKMYSDEAMTKFPYILHAVLVHEGQAASGHYWAYIHDPCRDQWLKFNDITVSDASWEELEKESVGGYHNASAYCLMYVDKTRIQPENVIGSEKEPSGIADLENLPDDLKEIVTSDNQAFMEEIEKWDKDMVRKAAGGGDADVTIVVEQKAASPPVSTCSSVSTQTVQPASSRAPPAKVGQIHAMLSQTETDAALKKVLPVYDQHGTEQALQEAVNAELRRLKDLHHNLNKLFPYEDPRHQNIVLYLLHCDCPKLVFNRIVMEQFLERRFEENEKIRKMKVFAGEACDRFTKEGGDTGEEVYKFWHETFQMFRKATYLFYKGTSFFFDEHYPKALPYLVHAQRLNMTLMNRSKNAGLPEPKVLAFFLRQCLLHRNDTITQTFEERSEVTDLLQEMVHQVLPCLQVLQQTGYQDDITATEEIREKWCSFLGQEMEAHKIEKLQDFLSKLFDPPIDMRIPVCPSIDSKEFMVQQLHRQYQTVMDVAQKSGYVERALKSS